MQHMPLEIPAYCDVAFKEWAAVCAALTAGRQTIILRKGGIHEGRGVFAPEHAAFWLYPTNFHQAAESLSSDASEFVSRAKSAQCEPGTVPLQHLAVVEHVRELSSEEAALRLAGHHNWSDATVAQRFCYRRPGLYLLVVRVCSSERVTLVQESAEMAGCKSWVKLPHPLPTRGLTPVLSDDQFTAASRRIDAALAESCRVHE
jgi:hypothetical protein